MSSSIVLCQIFGVLTMLQSEKCFIVPYLIILFRMMLKLTFLIGLLLYSKTNSVLCTNMRNFMSSRPPGKQSVRKWFTLPEKIKTRLHCFDVTNIEFWLFCVIVVVINLFWFWWLYFYFFLFFWGGWGGRKSFFLVR